MTSAVFFSLSRFHQLTLFFLQKLHHHYQNRRFVLFCLFSSSLVHSPTPFRFFRSRQLSRVFACALQHRLLSRLHGSLARVLCRQCVPTCCCLAARLRAVSARLGAASAILLVDVCVFGGGARSIVTCRLRLVCAHARDTCSPRASANAVRSASASSLRRTRRVRRRRRRRVACELKFCSRFFFRSRSRTTRSLARAQVCQT